jgi:predicted Fe-Mo cluster-binding NifX family protein
MLWELGILPVRGSALESGVCVSIPSDDKVHVKVGHFGDGKYYLHYRVTPEGWTLARVVENPYAGEHSTDEEEEEKGKRPRIYEMNSGCHVIVATFFGPGGEDFMSRRGLRVVRVKPGTTVEEALSMVANMYFGKS